MNFNCFFPRVCLSIWLPQRVILLSGNKAGKCVENSPKEGNEENHNLIYATQNDNKENVLIMGMVLVSFQTVVQSDIWRNRSSITY